MSRTDFIEVAIRSGGEGGRVGDLSLRKSLRKNSPDNGVKVSTGSCYEHRLHVTFKTSDCVASLRYGSTHSRSSAE